MQSVIRKSAGVLALLIASMSARAETVSCAEIAELREPLKIVVPGVYCFKKNLTAPPSAVAAITIAVDDVVIDLNGFTLQGAPATTPTKAGIASLLGVSSVTVRNGVIRGFPIGVAVDGPLSTDFLIEGLQLEHIGAVALRLSGDRIIVRDNSIVVPGAAGGAALGGGVGIVIVGKLAQVTGNKVLEFATPRGPSIGIQVVGGAALVERNTLHNSTVPAFNSAGIVIDSSGTGPASGTTVVDNRVINAQIGINVTPNGSGIFRDNIVGGAEKPFVGGILAGDSNVSF